jgi:hypothetical protein
LYGVNEKITEFQERKKNKDFGYKTEKSCHYWQDFSLLLLRQINIAE